MKVDPTSLDNLHDLAMPPPEPWWPPTLGWSIIFGVLLAILLAMLLRRCFRWQENRYRREAIRLLGDPSFPDSDLPELVKRVALTAWPRGEVAMLTDEPLLNFLNRTGGNAFGGEIGKALEATAFDPRPARNSHALREAVRHWILKHHRETDTRK